jgi:hypothetical protein
VAFLEGLLIVARDGNLRTILLIMAASWLLLGALDIFYAVLAIDVLSLGDPGVGFLGAATGVGALLGSAVAVTLVGFRRLGRPLVLAGLAYGGAIVVAGLQPHSSAALLVVAGGGASVVYIASQTLVQRLAPPAVLSRAFGALEGVTMLATGVGALLVPVLIAAGGPTGGLVIAGLVVPVVVLASYRALQRIDRSAVLREREIELLRGDPIFAPLGPLIERIAASLSPVRAGPGTDIIRQGDPGDRFYLIGTGTLEVRIDDRPVGHLGPGESFGEIALLRNVPRTATVRATDEVELFALERDVFLEAVTGRPRSRARAAAVAAARLQAGVER